MDPIPVDQARRLALVRAGLLAGDAAADGGRLPRAVRGAGAGASARRAALDVVRRFGYLQLDTVSVAGARSHAIVLLSRLDGLDASVGEELLRPGQPLFEYWGHEASWIPLELYPAFEFRRRAFRHHPWWGDVVGQNRAVARRLRRRIRDEGPLRSVDMEGPGGKGWWDFKVAKQVAAALWSSGELAIRERRNFQRTYDLADRVIPTELRERPLPPAAAVETLLLRALAGHGWATTGTLIATWRLARHRPAVLAALARLAEAGAITACALVDPAGRRTAGWIRPADRELAARLARARPRRDRGVLLSPFDPLLWDRARVELLFGFAQRLEIFKPAAQRVYGYYCMPVLAGEELVARVDLKADRRAGVLRVVACHREPAARGARHGEAVRSAIARFAAAVHLERAV